MAERDGDHWLWRLSAGAWLAAAVQELEQGVGVLSVRRSAVTHARRAAGMGLNGVLVAMAARGWSAGRSEAIWGRSYIDHLRTLANPELDPQVREPFGAELGQRCRELLAIPVMPGTGPNDLVRLGRGRDEAAILALAVARQIVDDCVAVVDVSRS